VSIVSFVSDFSIFKPFLYASKQIFQPLVSLKKSPSLYLQEGNCAKGMLVSSGSVTNPAASEHVHMYHSDLIFGWPVKAKTGGRAISLRGVPRVAT
jgi:hypothetical protein